MKPLRYGLCVIGLCISPLWSLPASAAATSHERLFIRTVEEIPNTVLHSATLDPQSPLGELKRLAPGMRPLVDTAKVPTQEDLRALQRHRLTRYFIIDTHQSSPAQADALAEQLKQNPLVEYAEFEPRAEGMHQDNGQPDASVSRQSIPDYTPRQYYLQGPQPVPPYQIGGVNAVEARSIPGAKGAGIQVISSEIDHWAYDHVDLPPPNIEKSEGANVDEHDTASVGIIASKENNFGTTGIVPDARVGYLEWDPEWLLQMAQQLASGAVMQLGVQYDYSPINKIGCIEDCLMPLEYNTPTRDIIAYTVKERGIHVVLAAGNGNINLDHPGFDGEFDRNRFDSGALYAGAVDPKTGLRASYSNYGKRVDLFSWGANVTTTYWSEENPTTLYTHTYAGTSSANPIIAGVIAALLGAAHAHGLGIRPPWEINALLVATGRPQINGNDNEIGVQPNVTAAIKKMLADNTDLPPTGRLALPEEVKSDDTFEARVYAESPSQKPLTYHWDSPGFIPPEGTGDRLSLRAPLVDADVQMSIAATVSDGTHAITLRETITIKAQPGQGNCGNTLAWDAGKTYSTSGETVSYKGMVYKQNYWSINKPPDEYSADYGKEWFTGTPCP